MTSYYLDTSALVKAYVREAGSETISRIVNDQDSTQVVLLAITRAEFHSALRKKQRENGIQTETINQIVAIFESHLASRFLMQPVSDTVISIAVDLLHRHPLKAYDAVQLAGCLALASGTWTPTFVCADRALLKAASTEGIPTLHPSDTEHP